MQVKQRNYTVEEVARIKCCSVYTARKKAKSWGGRKEAQDGDTSFCQSRVARRFRAVLSGAARPIPRGVVHDRVPQR